MPYKVGNLGGLYPVVMNAANEKAVELFLLEQISFLDIEKLVIEAVEGFTDNISNPTIAEIISTNNQIF